MTKATNTQTNPTNTSFLYSFDQNGKAHSEGSYSYSEPKSAKEFKLGNAVLREGHYAMVAGGKLPQGSVVREAKSFEAYQALNAMNRSNGSLQGGASATVKQNAAELKKAHLVSYFSDGKLESVHLRQPTTERMGEKLQAYGLVLIKSDDGTIRKNGKPGTIYGFVSSREFETLRSHDSKKYTVVEAGKPTKDIVKMMVSFAKDAPTLRQLEKTE